jgi:hypothetical protein
LATDIGVANHWLVLTDTQAAIDARPKLLDVIEQAEQEDSKPGKGIVPFRIHRTRLFSPVKWDQHGSQNRVAEMSRWERDTLQPKYGIPWGIEFCTTAGTMAIYDVEFFFAPWSFRTPPEIFASQPSAPQRMTYFPRVGYNIWNTKYFILPRGQILDHDERGIFTMLFTADGARNPILAQSAITEDDYVVVRNPEYLPRAWVVHQAEFIAPIFGLLREDRTKPMERLLSRPRDAGLAIWESAGPEFPIRERAMIETWAPEKLAPFLAPARTNEREQVRFDVYRPGHLEMDVHLEAPGLVTVAQTYFPGWQATVDGKPAPVLRANRAMQAIPVPSGQHRINLHYECRPLWIGAFLSALGWFLVLGWWMKGWFSRG